MPLIGRNTVTGNFIKCSNLTPDGSTTTFTLTNSKTSDNVYPGDQNSLLVSVSGVIQNPGTAYTINNNQITFTTAPSISDTIDFIVIMGDLVAIGTPSNDTVDTVHIKDGAVHNTKLQNSAITINGTSISLGASGTIVAGTDWQAVITADGSTFNTAVAGEGYFIDTTSAAHTITLPTSPTQGDEVTIVDYAGTFGTNNVTVGRNGSNIDGTAADGTLSTNRLNVRFVYIDSTQGWRAIFDDASESYGASYLSATGGTVTESGDYKIHTFTGDGCFVVSCAGSPAGSDSVEYIVVAGGASGGGGYYGAGGGAGGFRFASPSLAPLCYPGKPLAGSNVPVSATTYPVTVGGGGSGVSSMCVPGNAGSNSVFSTITSAGGGGGGTWGNSAPNVRVGLPGGSGGGGGSNNSNPGQPGATTGGSGNTPPVSPPQGNNGGNGNISNPSGPQSTAPSAGGGGATAVGGNYCATTPGGPGVGGVGGAGAGVPTAFGSNGETSGCYQYYAGGGGGAGSCATGNVGGVGGGGYGGRYTPSPISPSNLAQSGTTNTGGGGGGAIDNGPSSGVGGSGIVIIRYKFQ